MLLVEFMVYSIVVVLVAFLKTAVEMSLKNHKLQKMVRKTLTDAVNSFIESEKGELRKQPFYGKTPDGIPFSIFIIKCNSSWFVRLLNCLLTYILSFFNSTNYDAGTILWFAKGCLELLMDNLSLEYFNLCIATDLQGRHADVTKDRGLFERIYSKFVSSSEMEKLDSILISVPHQNEKCAQYHMEQSIYEISKGVYKCMFYRNISFKNFDFTYFVIPWLRQHFYFAENVLPSDVIDDPDEYLQPGDIISVPIGTQFYKKAHHFAIYIGNKQVAHVSGHGGRKAESVARIGNFCPDFVERNGIVKKLIFTYKIREPERIVEIAKDFAEEGYGKGMYFMPEHNCQHFVTLCALGIEFSPEISMFAFFLTYSPAVSLFIQFLLACGIIVPFILKMQLDQNFVLNDSPSDILCLWLSITYNFGYIFLIYDFLKNTILENER